MVDIFEILKVIFLGIVEGITEWLPISSTGHMLLVDEFIKMDVSESFKEMFFVVIQLGAILAVVLMFFKKMFPFQLNKSNEVQTEKKPYSNNVTIALFVVGLFVVMMQICAYIGNIGKFDYSLLFSSTSFGQILYNIGFLISYNIVGILGLVLLSVAVIRLIQKESKVTKKRKIQIKKDTMSLWFKVVVACIPGAVITILFDDFIEAHLHTPIVIAATLIIYGIAFIIIERGNKKAGSRVKMKELSDLTYKDALLIGLFQVLSIIPGTSRSGSTIIGALLIGVSRVAAAEFTFFLAVPVMFGLSAIKLLKFGLAFTSAELIILATGMLTAFIVSVLVIKFLMGYIKKHDFQAFGWYRIVLGLVVLAYFLIF